jgi:hypothetical protein
MTRLEEELLRALRECEEAARLMPVADPKPNLLPLFERIEELTRQLPEDSDPNLLHYLRRKSYEKARVWLEDNKC